MAKKRDDEEVTADEKAAEELRNAAEQEKAEPKEDERIPVDKDEEEDSEDREPSTRQARRAQRYHANRQQLEAAENRAREVETQLAAERAARAAAEQYARMIQTKKEPAGHPADDEIKKIDDELLQLTKMFNLRAQGGNFPDEEAAEMQRRYIALQSDRAVAAYKKQQPAQQNQQDPGKAAFFAYLQMEYPDVVNHGQAWRYVNALADAEVARGRQVNKDVIAELMHNTRKAFGFATGSNGSRAPSANERRKYQGAPSGSGAGGEPAPRTVRMNKAYRQMAEAAYPELAKRDPALAHRKWAQTVGKQAVEDGVDLDE